MANITFVYPDFESLGVEYLMAACKTNGHHVHFVYYEADDTYTRIRKNPSYTKVATDILNTYPDIVAFSCVTDNYQHQLKVAKNLKTGNSKIYTIFGGIHPTAVPEIILSEDIIDAVAIGEAEHSLVDFLYKCQLNSSFVFPEEAVEGIVFKKNGLIIGNYKEGKLVDLDTLSFPEKEPIYKEIHDSSNEYRIITSRGCPYLCSYCFNSYMHNLRGSIKMRRRSVSNVIEELILAKKQFSIKYVLFVDDSFTTDKRWIEQFSKEYKKEVGLPFACVGNPYYINEDIVSHLADAGCVNFQLGIQSLSETLCKETLNRNSINTQIEKAIHLLKQKKIMIQVDHMLGIPNDTLQSQENAVLFYNIHRPHLISIFWLTYYPRTDIIQTAKSLGIINQQNIDCIEQGIKITSESYLTGGSLKNPQPYYSISFTLNWLPLIPKPIIVFLIKTHLYRIFKIKHYYISTALPRIIRSIIDKRDFRGRSHIIRFKNKLISKWS